MSTTPSSLTAEFRRNLWLEFSVQRLIALPVILFILVFLANTASSYSAGSTAQVGLWAFYGLVFLWGSRRAASAVAEEVNGGTWTGQRLSALSSVSLTFGKLFGATAYVWYGGLLGLALAAWGELEEGRALGAVTSDLLQRLFSGVLLHAVAMTASLALLNKRRVADRLGVTFAQLLALAASLFALGFFLRDRVLWGFDLSARSIVFYGERFDSGPFLVLSIFIFMLWALLAAQRLMAVQLQRAPRPWAWPLFVVFCMVYVGGLGSSQLDSLRSDLDRSALLFSVALFATYVALFAERNEPLRFRRLAAAWSGGLYRRALSLLPWWATSWLILLLYALWTGFGSRPLDLGLFADLLREAGIGQPVPLAASVAFPLFVLRDIAFVLFINSGRPSERADLTAFVYLLVFYVPLTSLVVALGHYRLATYLVPLPVLDSWGPALAAAAQAALLFVLTGLRWRRLFRA